MHEQPSYRLGTYAEFDAGGELAPFVQALWVHAAAPDDPTSAHRVVPDHALSIAFSCRRDARGAVSDAQLLLIGPVRTPRVVVREPGTELVAIRVHPEWSQRLLDVSPGEHPNAVVDLAGVTRVVTGSLAEQLAESRSPIEALRMLRTAAEGVARRLRQPGGSDAAVVRAAEALRRSRGRAGVEALAGLVGLSSRHLRRAFTSAVGMSPKAAARMIRFHRVLAATDGTRSVDWADTALRFGYADQAHMIHEFSAFSGFTPAALHRERVAESDSSNLS
ncbi:MAG TPA: AraC family transcriptional regulator [Thermoanaerobaculia bacterium]|nr:AraC family transcriptional regulator [Thermoanaerobaculia bacterium]